MAPEEREAVITGLGAVTPVGRDVASTWEALVAGRSGIRRIAAFDASGYSCRVAGEVLDYTPHARLDPQVAGRLDRGSLFAIDAAYQALDDSALPLTSENASQVGLVLGSARPGEGTVWAGQRAFHEGGPGAMSAGYLSRTLPNASAAQTAAALGVRGPVAAVCAGGASSGAALALAAGLIRSGEARVVFAGGADAAITPPSLAAFCAMRILTSRNDEPARAVRPFDAAADGMALAEGGAFLVLEDEALARERGARIYARLAGYASVMEPGALRPAAPEAGRALQAALRMPALLQNEIDYFCAYAPGSPDLDPMETAAIKRVFGELRASKLTVSAPKSMLGHMLGAATAADAIVCVKAIETGTIPPTINLEQPAEGCDLDYTANQSRREPVRNAMTYSFGFGGHHVALVLSAVH